MLKNKCNTTIARDVTESCHKIMKITGIVTSRIPAMHLQIKRCPNLWSTNLRGLIEWVSMRLRELVMSKSKNGHNAKLIKHSILFNWN